MRNALRGVHWARGRKSRTFVINRRGLLELHVFESLTALTGNGVGGGSLIYGDIQSQPDDSYFDFFPLEITAQEMRPYYARVRAMLAPSPFPVLPARSAILRRVADGQGWNTMQAELAVAWSREPSHPQSTSYLLGSEHQGKRSMDKTYIPLAVRTGAEVRALCEVDRIERATRHYRVQWVDHERGTRNVVESPIIILAAGTLGTLRLMFRARDVHRTLSLPPALGRHFSTGGDAAVTLYECDGADDSAYGPSPASGVAVERHGKHSLFIVESGLPADSMPLPAAVRRRLRRSVGLAGMGRDSSTGVVTFDGAELRTGTGRSLDGPFFDDLEAALATIAEAYHPKKMTFDRGTHARLTTVHPMGGASISHAPDGGVVDHTGEVFGNTGLYVADASAFPHAPGWPPSMTIASLAERQAELIVGRFGRP
jgi:cholesterol oxidase